MAKRLLISALAILAGLFLITLLTEGIEMLVVVMSSDKPLSELTQDPAEYFAVRNQPANIALKLVYNTIAAFIGGYVCAGIGRWRPFTHTLVLAGIQTLGFVYGMTFSEYANTSPVWLWLTLMILTVVAILSAGYLRKKRKDGTPLSETSRR
jgi:hypothetical protein